MQRDADRYRVFTRRSLILGGGQVIAMSALAARMYYLQVIEGEKYKTLAEENRISLRLLAPPRGRIVDRFGRPMAVNQQNYRVMLIPENTPDISIALETLRAIIEITDADEHRIRREIRRRRRFLPVVIRENLPWRKVAQIEVNAPALPGVLIDVGETRFYPFGEETAPVLGYVAPAAEKDQTGDPLLELPGFRIGRSGLEKVHDLSLRGKGGTSQVEVNALGRSIRELSRNDGTPGADARLTIDLELQRFAAERLGDEAAAAVVLDIHSGEILSMASTPSFDPNAFNRGLSGAEWNALVRNPRGPLNNKAITGQYSPGSTFKMIVALAALEKGVVNVNSQFFCRGHIQLGKTRFHCWKRHGHGMMDVVDAITQSCDVYFYEIAGRTGIDAIAEMARRLGLGQKVGNELPGERAGLIPTRAWKRAVKDEPWHKGETLHAGIGQGFILTTPLQLAVMTARLVNGGRAVEPRLTQALSPQALNPQVQDPRALHLQGQSAEPSAEQSNNLAPAAGPQATPFADIGLQSEHLDLIKRAMARVSNHQRGTAYRARIKEKGWELGGKTGTVQVRRITKGERETGVIKNKDLPWEERDHALFVGFAPVDAPRYAISVLVEHGGGGSSTAAPIARDIMLEVQRRDPSGRQADSDTGSSPADNSTSVQEG
ncbi:MAG: penicillin-binding protein 2 [Proteobacteria bacterium]|nr:penicillin-binding protein 2 [Pseudomonadota bacterium]